MDVVPIDFQAKSKKNISKDSTLYNLLLTSILLAHTHIQSILLKSIDCIRLKEKSCQLANKDADKWNDVSDEDTTVILNSW